MATARAEKTAEHLARAWWSTVCPVCGRRLLDRADGAANCIETDELCYCSQPPHVITVRWCRGCYEHNRSDRPR